MPPIRLTPLLVAASLYTACASAPPRATKPAAPTPAATPSGSESSGPESSGPESSDAGTGAVRVPKVLDGPPAAEHIDLGPVLLPADKTPAEGSRALLIAADALGADAFVREGRELSEFYSVRLEAVGTYLARSSHGPVPITEYVYLTTTRPGGGRDFYRAIRYVKGTTKPCDFSETTVNEDALEVLSTAGSLRDQLRVLNVLFVHGALPPREYRKLRRWCLELRPKR